MNGSKIVLWSAGWVLVLIAAALGQTTAGGGTTPSGGFEVPVVSSDPAVLLSLAKEYAPWGEARARQRGEIAAQVTSVLLTDGPTIQSVGLARWKEFASLLGSSLSEEVKGTWAGKITQAFAPTDEALYALNAAQLRDLAATIGRLGQAKAASDLVWQWLKHQEGSGLARSEAAETVLVGLGTKPKLTDEQLKQLEAMDRQWAVDNSVTPLGVSECMVIVRIWHRLLRDDKLKEWSLRAYDNTLGSEAARAKADTSALAALGDILKTFGWTREGKGFPGFAEVVARLGREGTLKPGYAAMFAGPLGTPETRLTVRNELLDSQGNPRLELARVLSRAYKNAGGQEFKSWQEFIDGRIAAAGSEPDSKALWLLVKADAEQHVPKVRYRFRSKQWLDRALAAASSEPVRLTAVKELADYFAELDALPTAASMLESITDQFQGETVIKVLAMRQDLQARIASQQAAKERKHQIAAVLSKKGRLAYFRECLARSQAAGDGATAEKLQTVIAGLETELAK